ncbi:M67 family metallopeptidase [Saccharomonospora iraqiensis]|uniref:Mov34/MPN/PAD-1 family protein n=1 Tax=Saccharomonospora iraqiensis TaxID=52698 RepID=UPI00047CEDBD|nr:M67 family metallopeptidase [Saccharomonospora iraqiensis]
MLQIRRELVDAIVAHARADHPDEACGVIAGPDDGTDRPERFVPMVNAVRSPTFYEFDSADLLKLYREMDARDEKPVVIYHSHTATEAYPSRTDIKLAQEPFAHYVLVSTRDPEEHELRSYRIVDGEVTEEPVEIIEDGTPRDDVVESYMFANTGSDDVPDER